MLEYEIAPNLKAFTHGFFKRKGGVSKGIYNSLNCGMSSKDKKDNIIKNRKMISESLNFNINKLIVANQSHSNKVKILNKFEYDEKFQNKEFALKCINELHLEWKKDYLEKSSD